MDHAIQDQLIERTRHAAEERGERESEDRRDEILFAPKTPLKPRRQWDDDHVRDDEARRDPGRLIERRAEIALNVWQGNGDDRGVERLHQRREHDRSDDDEPARLGEIRIEPSIRISFDGDPLMRAVDGYRRRNRRLHSGAERRG